MRDIPSSISTALQSSSFTTFVLVTMEFPSGNGGTVRLTSLPRDVTVGGNTYTSDGGLDEYSPPSISTVVDREVYRIKLVDNANVFKRRADNGNILGVPVTVQMGVNDDTGNLDTIYQGRIDGVETEVDLEGMTKTTTIECSSPFADLGLTNLRMTTRAFQQAIDSGDECFNQVGVKIDAAERQWGKKGTVSGQGTTTPGTRGPGSFGL